VIYSAGDGDIPQILGLQRQEFAGADSDIMEAIEKGYTLVDKSCDSDLINGYIIVTCPDNTPYIYSMAVERDMRKSGIATRLIKEVEHWHKAADYKKIWLKTGIDNPAQKLYFDLGYRIFAFDAHLYGAGIPGISMWKSLK